MTDYRPTMRIAALLATFLLASCNSSHQTPAPAPASSPESTSSAMTTEISIKLGEMGAGFAKRYPSLVRVQHQPAGLDFYKVDWNSRPRGTVRVDHEKHSFVITDVLGVLSTQDLQEFKSEGLNEFTVTSGLSAPPPSLISHDDARLKIHAILRQVLEAGWKPVVPRSRPRLVGASRLAYALNASSSIGLDPAHVPTLDEWIRIESRTAWGFHADGVFLEVNFTRETSMTDPAKPGAYLLTFEFKAAAEYYRGFASPEDRLRWNEVLSAELAKAAEQRKNKENELRARGVKIDEGYQDPPIPAFK